jgi:acetyltransferase-like isoleucine patch superfamily enzyme
VRVFRFMLDSFRGILYSLFLKGLVLHWRIGALTTFRGTRSNFNIGYKFKCGELGRFECFGSDAQLIIGDNVKFGVNVHIGILSEVILHDNVLMGSNILIIDHNHGFFKDENNVHSAPSDRRLMSKGPIVIEENVWVCDNVAILGGSVIKRGSVVPYGTVVKGVYEN